ncbi:hypothetical protein HYPSUDRAFT_208217 [Hypholoma sublateritium FD-334 SS-4]|uniref:Uncharacterized protein n=1 Tax=Hypholoma sublateritium (strain FD-334 SS-4) TaxID=945553 RepID=A0A0D2LW14_HYPSF|nr:hypothetical protein HYPSUDRAFT_208217 [Hypholoma sublateritium FD-334 SS-4]
MYRPATSHLRTTAPSALFDTVADHPRATAGSTPSPSQTGLFARVLKRARHGYQHQDPPPGASSRCPSPTLSPTTPRCAPLEHLPPFAALVDIDVRSTPPLLLVANGPVFRRSISRAPPTSSVIDHLSCESCRAASPHWHLHPESRLILRCRLDVAARPADAAALLPRLPASRPSPPVELPLSSTPPHLHRSAACDTATADALAAADASNIYFPQRQAPRAQLLTRYEDKDEHTAARPALYQRRRLPPSSAHDAPSSTDETFSSAYDMLVSAAGSPLIPRSRALSAIPDSRTALPR